MIFQVFLQSDDTGAKQPFPGCKWHEFERRWEWEASDASALYKVTFDIKIPILLLPVDEDEPPTMIVCDVGIDL